MVDSRSEPKNKKQMTCKYTSTGTVLSVLFATSSIAAYSKSHPVHTYHGGCDNQYNRANTLSSRSTSTRTHTRATYLPCWTRKPPPRSHTTDRSTSESQTRKENQQSKLDFQNSLSPGNLVGLLEVRPAPTRRPRGEGVPAGPGRPLRQPFPDVRHVSEPSDQDEPVLEYLLRLLLTAAPIGHRRGVGRQGVGLYGGHRERDGLVQRAQSAVAGRRRGGGNGACGNLHEGETIALAGKSKERINECNTRTIKSAPQARMDCTSCISATPPALFCIELLLPLKGNGLFASETACEVVYFLSLSLFLSLSTPLDLCL